MENKFEEFQLLINDQERWKWILQNQRIGITVYLDNDETYAQFDDDEDAEYLMDFDEYI